MSDETSAPVAEAASAGALLRRAREAAGLELGSLSATIKVAQRKLEALEADRYDQLPDAVFTRALALTVCRALKIDAAPVLALLPAAKEAQGLEHVTQGLNQPFDERGGAVVRMLSGGWGGLLRPGVLAPLCLAGGALALYLWPHRPQLSIEAPATPVVAASAPQAVELPASDGMLTTVVDHDLVANAPPPHASEPPEVSPNAGEFPPAASAAVAGASTPRTPAAQTPAASPAPRATIAPAVTSVAAPASVPAARTAAASTPASVAAVAAPAQPLAGGDAVAVKTKEDSWVDVRDAKGRVLVSRLVRAGEALSLSGAAPLQVKIGNARGTELQFRGRAVDLSAARDNVARMELK